jgi:hypothetical protein
MGSGMWPRGRNVRAVVDGTRRRTARPYALGVESAFVCRRQNEFECRQGASRSLSSHLVMVNLSRKRRTEMAAASVSGRLMGPICDLKVPINLEGIGNDEGKLIGFSDEEFAEFD